VAQNVILLVVAMVGLTLFADRFVAGAAQLAARLNVSTVVAGALIIGFGTSAPELVVSTVATLTEGAEGTALGIGNIVGANVANLTLVLSVPALVFGGIAIQKGVKRQAVLSATGVTVFALAAYVGQPTVVKGVGMALLMVVALRIVVRLGEGVDDGVEQYGDVVEVTHHPPLLHHRWGLNGPHSSHARQMGTRFVPSDPCSKPQTTPPWRRSPIRGRCWPSHATHGG